MFIPITPDNGTIITRIVMISATSNPPEHIKEWIKNHTEQEDPQLRTPLCFTANEPGATVSLIGWDENNYEQCDVFVHLQYSTDNMQTWSSGDWDGHEITLANTGDKVYIRASQDNVNGMAYYDEEQGYVTKYHKFYLTGSIGASGNIQYLLTLDGSRTDVPTYAYIYLFSQVETFNEETYECEYSDIITTAPALPATTLANYCYYSMFQNCTSLTQAPALPATSLANLCYGCMFSGCTKLSSIDVNFSEWNPTDATSDWVINAGTDATGTKTFTCPAALPQTRGSSNIPTEWTIVTK